MLHKHQDRVIASEVRQSRNMKPIFLDGHVAFAPHHNAISEHGFTLVELAMVLVVIGLLVVGISAGSGLIHNSALLSVISDFQNFKNATIAFKERYGGLPGDLPNATSVWPSPPSDITIINGNGDSIIDPCSSEGYQFWAQLSLSGLLSGRYPGSHDANGNVIAFGSNVPASRISSTGYSICTGATANFLAGSNVVTLGSAIGDTAVGPIISGIDSHSIDAKIDDGNALTGIVRPNTSNASGCIDNNTSSKYYMADDGTTPCAIGYDLMM